MVKIYYRDEAEHTYLKEKYPELAATYLPIPDDKKADMEGPLVCSNDEPIDECQVGEKHIERLAHLKEFKDEA